MIRTYRYRLYPGPHQRQQLADILDLSCWLYNRALEHRRKRWGESRHDPAKLDHVTYNQQAALWRDWRNEAPEENPLRLLKMTAGQQVLRRLDSAYRQFLQGKRGVPRFRQAACFNSVNYKPGDGAQLKDRRLYVQNVGTIRVRWHRQRPGGVLQNIVMVRKPSGWYVLLQYEWDEPAVAASTRPAVGVDLDPFTPTNSRSRGADESRWYGFCRRNRAKCCKRPVQGSTGGFFGFAKSPVFPAYF